MRRDKVLLGAAMSCEWTASCSTGLTKALCPAWSVAALKAGTACIVAKNWQSFQASTSEQATWDPWTLLNLLLRPSPVSREHRELALPHWEGGSFNPASHAAAGGSIQELASVESCGCLFYRRAKPPLLVGEWLHQSERALIPRDFPCGLSFSFLTPPQILWTICPCNYPEQVECSKILVSYEGGWNKLKLKYLLSAEMLESVISKAYV